MLVIAAKGLKVAREENPRTHILDTPPDGEAGYIVPETPYYTRCVLDGDLIDLEAPVVKAPSTKAAGKSAATTDAKE